MLLILIIAFNNSILNSGINSSTAIPSSPEEKRNVSSDVIVSSGGDGDAFGSVIITAPTLNEVILNDGSTHYLVWDENGLSGTFTLYLSLDDGVTYPEGAPLFLNPFDGPLDFNYATENALPGYPYVVNGTDLLTTQARWKLVSDSNPLVFGVSARFIIQAV